MSVGWNPWHGCKKISEGCMNCYVYRTDSKYDVDSSIVRKTGNFNLPVRRKRDKSYKVPAGQTVHTCFTSDFFVDKADEWRNEAWAMMRERSDLNFMFFTKRIHRLCDHLPEDWGDGYENVTIGCTVENQKRADQRLPIFLEAPIRHKIVICAPLIDAIDLSPYLGPCIELVSVGGESGTEARVCDYNWVLDLRRQCVENKVSFHYHQTGARLLKDGRIYRIKKWMQTPQAYKANINYTGSYS